jgi:prevent-host-death family protein
LTGQNSVREIQSSEAKAKFAQILEEVANGETVVITRRGEPIARLMPEAEARSQSRRKVFDDIRQMRATLPRLTLEEILSARHEGHKS